VFPLMGMPGFELKPTDLPCSSVHAPHGLLHPWLRHPKDSHSSSLRVGVVLSNS
jgi:hypothetical protein